MKHKPPYALYDVRGKCWLGDSDGVTTFDDWDKALCAATIVGEQLGCLVLAQPYDGTAKKFKDEVPVKMTGEEAVKRVEGKAR